MDVTTQLLFFFSALGAFNGSLLAAYSLLRPKSQFSDKILAALLLMISVRVGKSVFFYFSADLSKVYLQIGLSACFLIGPFLYLFVLSHLHGRKLNNVSVLHGMVPCVIAIVVGLSYPYTMYPDLWGNVFYKVVNYTWLAYLIAAIYPLYRGLRIDHTTLSANRRKTLALSVYIGSAAIWLAYFTASYTSYIAGALSFSLVFYLTLLLLFWVVKDKQASKYQKQKIERPAADSIAERLECIMEKDKLYNDPNITLPKLSKHLGESAHTLSQFLNDNLQISFANYINKKRIDYAKLLLRSSKSSGIERIAEQSGYNSLSTFYTSFKKFTGMTPAQFRDKSEG